MRTFARHHPPQPAPSSTRRAVRWDATPADDAYEREAEQVADAVLQAPPTATASALTPRSTRQGAAPVRDAGHPLPAAALDFFGPRFGYDFSHVRVHADAAAAASAQQQAARAYTFGHHIVFDVGQYAPETPAGQQVLAHELTHVVQQAAVGSPGLTVQRLPAVGASISRVPVPRVQRLINRDASAACATRRPLPLCSVAAGPVDPLIAVFTDALTLPGGSHTIFVDVQGQLVGGAGHSGGAGQPLGTLPRFTVSLWQCGALPTPVGGYEASDPITGRVTFERMLSAALPPEALGLEDKAYFLKIDNRSMAPLQVTLSVATNATAPCP